MSVELETEVDQVFRNLDHLGSVDITTNEESRVRSRQLETVDREQSSPISLVNILSEGGDLSSGSHLDAPEISQTP